MQGNPHPPVDDKTTVSNDETTSSDDNDDDDPQGNPHPPANEKHGPAVPDPVGSINPVDPDSEGDEGHSDANGPVDTDIPIVNRTKGSVGESGTRLFPEGQGFKVIDNVVHQDNQSVMLLA